MYRHIYKARTLLNEVISEEPALTKELDYPSLYDYYLLKTDVFESWMNYTDSINNIKEKLIPLSKENEKDNLNAHYLLAKANWFGNRKVRAYYMLNDIVNNHLHSAENRILSHLHLAWTLTTLSSNKGVDDQISNARKLIDKHKELLGLNSQYLELLCQLEESKKYQKFRFEYKFQKSLNNILDQSFKILEKESDEKYYQLIFDVLFMKSLSENGLKNYGEIKPKLNSSHCWSLFDSYSKGEVLKSTPIFGDYEDLSSKDKLASVIYYMTPYLTGGKNAHIYSTFLKASQTFFIEHQGESCLDLMTAVRTSNAFATPELVLPFYYAQKDIAKSIYKERNIIENSDNWFLLFEDISNINNLRYLDYVISEEANYKSFIEYHCQNPNLLDDTLDFHILKLGIWSDIREFQYWILKSMNQI